MKLEVTSTDISLADAIKDYVKKAASPSDIELRRVALKYKTTLDRYALAILCYKYEAGNSEITLVLGPGGPRFTGKGPDLEVAMLDAFNNAGELDEDTVNWAKDERSNLSEADSLRSDLTALRDRIVAVVDKM